MDIFNCISTMLLVLKIALIFAFPNVKGEMCGVLTVATGGSRVSLMEKTISAFAGRCRHAVITTNTTTKNKGDLIWPRGVYGLPRPTSGCPTNSGVIWKTGFRFQDTESTNPSNYWYPSTGIQLLGPYGKSDITQNFCMKTRDHTDEADGDWPQGKYCVFKYGESCPGMMSSGFIFWNDEDSGNINEVQGTVPSGVYDQDTRIEYCCMTGGDVSRPIRLPTQNPFYLFAYNSEQCQVVRGMAATEEYFRWDEQDFPNWHPTKKGGSRPYMTFIELDDASDNIVYYCYYEAIDS